MSARDEESGQRSHPVPRRDGPDPELNALVVSPADLALPYAFPGLAELRAAILALVLRVALQPGFSLPVGEAPLTNFVGGGDEELWIIGAPRP